MKHFIYLLSLISIISCADSDISNSDLLLGTWKDVQPSIDFENDTLGYATYHIFEDGKYEVEYELPYYVQGDGTWTYDEQAGIVDIRPHIYDSISFNQTNQWKIISLTSELLELTYELRIVKQDTADVVLPIYRKFEKQ